MSPYRLQTLQGMVPKSRYDIPPKISEVLSAEGQLIPLPSMKLLGHHTADRCLPGFVTAQHY